MMRSRKPFLFRAFSVVVVVALLGGCIDPIQFEVPEAQQMLIVDGMISDAPGPYTVKLSQGIDLNSDSAVRTPVRNATLILYNDLGESEDFTEIAPGDYSTGGSMRGMVGRSYHIAIETADGNTFESLPDPLKAVGEIQSIRYEFEAGTKEESFGVQHADVFKVMVDSKSLEGAENYVRWRYKGTYKVITYPFLHWYWLSGFELKRPWECSGYTIIPGQDFNANPLPPEYKEPPGEGQLSKVSECTCCTCYVNEFENIPQLSDAQFVANNEFRNIQVGVVPINTETFYEKFLIEVEQMSLSPNAFRFFKLVRAQKDGTSSLFQPATSEISGNVIPTNNKAPVVGIFWASSVSSKSTFIKRSDVPYTLSAVRFVTYPCAQYYPNATTQVPDLWE